MIAFVSGGARSGKSAVAEAAVLKAAGASTPYYVATARISDDEMAARIARHRQTRGSGWATLEAPLALAQAIGQVPDHHAVLLDCLTLWASQVLYLSIGTTPMTPDSALSDLASGVADARRRGITLVLVSNDVNEALLPGRSDESAETWRYVAFLQRVHCWLAACADSVLEVVAGRALEWKPVPHAPRDSGELH